MFLLFFFFKHKTAYEMRISDWSSDVCSSDLIADRKELEQHAGKFPAVQKLRKSGYDGRGVFMINSTDDLPVAFNEPSILEERVDFEKELSVLVARNQSGEVATYDIVEMEFNSRSEEHTSELQSLMRNSYAVFCLKTKIEKKKK